MQKFDWKQYRRFEKATKEVAVACQVTPDEMLDLFIVLSKKTTTDGR